MSEEVKTEETKEKSGIKAKSVSLWGQIIAALWIAGWHSAQFVSNIKNGIQIDCISIITSGLSIAACFTPVYFNLIMDKIKDIKFGGSE